MSWCDKLASTPSIGFRLDAHFASSAAILEAMSPILDNLGDGDNPRFTIERHEPFAAAFSTEDGFQYGVEPSKIYVAFQHRLRARPVSGGLPVMQMLSQPLPFTELLPKVSDRLLEATLFLPGVKKRQVTRVGIVTTTTVADEDVPPGIARFIRYVSRPWKGAAAHFGFQITGDLGEVAGASDRCVHTLIKREEDPEQLVTLQFDWQRTFSTGHAITFDSLQELLVSARKASLAYFEDLAEGNRFDEDLISKAT